MTAPAMASPKPDGPIGIGTVLAVSVAIVSPCPSERARDAPCHATAPRMMRSASGPMGLKKRTDRPMPTAGAAQRNVMQEIEETRRVATQEARLMVPSVELVTPTQEFVWIGRSCIPSRKQPSSSASASPSSKPRPSPGRRSRLLHGRSVTSARSA